MRINLSSAAWLVQMAFVVPFNPCAPELSPRLRAALPLWERTAYRPEIPDAFCSGPDWQLSCHQIFDPGRSLYLKSSNTSILALAARRFSNGAVLLMPLDCGWCFGTTLLGPDCLDLLEEAVDEIDGPFRRTFVQLSGLEADHGFESLVGRFKRRHAFHKYGEVIMGSASLAGGMDGFLSRRTPHFRARARAIARKAKNSGVRFERARPKSREEASPLYERMLKIEAQSWKGRAGCGMDKSPSREYYAALLGRGAGRQAARIIIASLDGEDIGFIFGNIGGTIYRGQQFSYIVKNARLEPGNLLQLEMLQWLCEEGIERYDPGPCSGPRMQYKCHWVDGMRAISTWLIAPQ